MLLGYREQGEGAVLPYSAAGTVLMLEESHEVVGQALLALQITHHVSTIGITWGEQWHGWVGRDPPAMAPPAPPLSFILPTLLPALHTCVAAMHPDALPIVLALAPHHIVGEV